MSKRRIDKLEGSLSPKEAVKRWLTEAHVFGSLPTYSRWLIEQPESSYPLIGLPDQVEAATRVSLRRKPRRVIAEYAKQAVVDTWFLVRLVIVINRSIEEATRIEGLRSVALMWWMRTLGMTADEREPRVGDAMGWPGWLRAAMFHLDEVEGLEAARVEAERRFLDGHGCLFPDLEAGWQELRENAGMLVGVGRSLAPSMAVSADAPEASIDTDARLSRLVDRARVEAFDLAGYVDAALAVARQELDALSRAEGS